MLEHPAFYSPNITALAMIVHARMFGFDVAQQSYNVFRRIFSRQLFRLWDFLLIANDQWWLLLYEFQIARRQNKAHRN
jgi:hypothetical protein